MLLNLQADVVADYVGYVVGRMEGPGPVLNLLQALHQVLVQLHLDDHRVGLLLLEDELEGLPHLLDGDVVLGLDEQRELEDLDDLLDAVALDQVLGHAVPVSVVEEVGLEELAEEPDVVLHQPHEVVDLGDGVGLLVHL